MLLRGSTGGGGLLSLLLLLRRSPVPDLARGLPEMARVLSTMPSLDDGDDDDLPPLLSPPSILVGRRVQWERGNGPTGARRVTDRICQARAGPGPHRQPPAVLHGTVTSCRDMTEDVQLQLASSGLLVSSPETLQPSQLAFVRTIVGFRRVMH